MNYHRSDPIRASQMTRSVPANPVGTSVPRPATQHETLHGFHALQTNIGVQAPNEWLNDVLDIVRQQNSNAIEERIQCLEESLYNAPSHKNTIQEIFLRKTRVTIPKPFEKKRNKALQLKDRWKSKKCRLPLRVLEVTGEVMLHPWFKRKFFRIGESENTHCRYRYWKQESLNIWRSLLS